jgi:Uncharacterised nucleotidyltransferase
VETLESDTDVLWNAVDRTIDGATVSGLLANKLGPLGANRLRRLGRPVPLALQYEERAASVNMLTAAPLLQRIRSSCDGPLLIFKGPEVARLYPSAARRFGDIDLLVSDAQETQRLLLDAGFVASPDPDHAEIEGHHHLQPLKWPSIPLRIEVHSRPNWPPELAPPNVSEIFAASRPTQLGIEGVSAPRPDHHALILAAHAWRDVALDTLRDLIDIAAVSDGLDRNELDAAARRWGIGRIWQQTQRTIDALFFDGRRTFPLRTWARHIVEVRERTVFETHLERHASGFAYLPPRAAVARLGKVVVEEVRPSPGETWRDKLQRSRTAAAHASLPATTRERGIGQTTPLADVVPPERPSDDSER